MSSLTGVFQPSEKYFISHFPKAKLIDFVFLDPYWSDKPWTCALENKRVLVVHPFAELIESQFEEKRELLFEDKRILPAFKLATLKAVQSVGGESEFASWFEALEYMKNQIRQIDFDICLIGAGAYGLPLANYVKSLGKKSVHIGGTLQLLFGIWGRRWDNPEYGSQSLDKKGAYLKLKNINWVTPGENLRPKIYNEIENGCYW